MSRSLALRCQSGHQHFKARRSSCRLYEIYVTVQTNTSGGPAPRPGDGYFHSPLWSLAQPVSGSGRKDTFKVGSLQRKMVQPFQVQPPLPPILGIFLRVYRNLTAFVEIRVLPLRRSCRQVLTSRTHRDLRIIQETRGLSLLLHDLSPDVVRGFV